MIMPQVFERGKCRLLTIIITSLSLVVLLAYHMLSPAPSYVVTTLPYNKHQQKISVVLCFHQPSPTVILKVEKNLQRVLSTMKLQYETIVVLPPHSTFVGDIMSLFPSSSSHHHIEVLSDTTCSNAFSKAHFSVLLLIGANLTSFEDSIPKLVEPILNGGSDLILAENIKQGAVSLWKRFLSLLVYPITGTAYVPNTHILSMLTPLWAHGCHNVDSNQGSFSIELIGRCHIKNWSTTTVHLSEPTDHTHICLSQVLSLWWNLHPLMCLLVVTATVLFVTIATVLALKRKETVLGNKLDI